MGNELNNGGSHDMGWYFVCRKCTKRQRFANLPTVPGMTVEEMIKAGWMRDADGLWACDECTKSGKRFIATDRVSVKTA